MQRIVVTGATSMIGTALVKECIKNNIEILAIVRKGSARLGRLPKSEMIEIVECSLEQLDSIRDIKKNYDTFYHFAWGYTEKCSRDDPVLQEENIRYTLNAVELAHRLGCHKFIGAGSQAEYGRVDHMIRPDTAENPQISYGIAKYAAGRLSRKLCVKYNMVHIWGRIFSVYGKNDNEGTMLTYAISQFMQGKPARFSSAEQMWDYLYEEDAGRIFYLLGERIEENKVYCIASGESRPLKEFILEMQKAFGTGAKCEFAAGDSRQPAGLQADVRELFRDLTYRPVVTFEEGIKKMIECRKMELKGYS